MNALAELTKEPELTIGLIVAGTIVALYLIDQTATGLDVGIVTIGAGAGAGLFAYLILSAV
jgi:hypothetical protein